MARISRKQRLQTIQALLDGYGSLSVEQLLEPLAPGFQHHTLPESLGLPVLDIEMFEKHAERVFGVFEEFKMIPTAIITDDDADVTPFMTIASLPMNGQGGAGVTAAVSARMVGILKEGKRKWENECVMMIKMTLDGRQILEVREFVDSEKARIMFEKYAPEVFGGDAGVEGEKKNKKPSSGWLNWPWPIPEINQFAALDLCWNVGTAVLVLLGVKHLDTVLRGL